MTRYSLKLIVLLICWFGLTTILFGVAGKILPSRVSFPYNGDRLLEPDWLWNRANFDGAHYLWIAKNGYGLYEQPFFPLYPLLIQKVVTFVGHRELVIAVAISTLSFGAAVVVFYRLLRLDLSPASSFLIVGLVLAFPVSFVFMTAYAEALFLFLSVFAIYLARKGWWWWAGLATALATATRPTGMVLAVALFMEWAYQYRGVKNGEKKWFERLFYLSVRLLPLVIMPTGLFLYGLFLYQKTGDPLSFIHLQPMFGVNRSTTIVLPYQVGFRYLKIFLTVSRTSLAYFVALFEFGATFLFSSLAIFGFFFRIRPSYLVYLVLGIIVPSLTGTLSSEPRYLMVLFPGFIILGLLIGKRVMLRRFFILASLLGLVSCNLLFAAGYWVV